jgi:hypothetical protein
VLPDHTEPRSFDQEHPDAPVGNCCIKKENCRIPTLDTDPRPKMPILNQETIHLLAQKAVTLVMTSSPAKGRAGLALLIVLTPEAC